MRSRFTRFLAAASIAAMVGAMPASVVQADTPVTSERLTELESEEMVIRSESEQLGGSPSTSTSLSRAETRRDEIQQNIDRLGNVLEQLGTNRQELDRLRQEYSETDVVELKDVPGEVAEKGGEECIKRACVRYGGARVAPYVGWLFLAGDVVSYGGEYVIREINEARLRELVRNESAKHTEIFQLLMDQYCALSEQRAKVRRLRELRERARVLTGEIATERQRLTDRATRDADRPGRGRATRHAVGGRETDPAGDEAERQKALDDAVRPSGPTQPRRQGVWTSEPRQGAMNLSPFARDVLAAHNAERAQYGYPALNWNPALEATATAYAQQMAQTGRRVHAPRAGRGIERENINQGMLHWSTGQMLANWLQEKPKFTPGVFPTVCAGDWSTCAHYTQMIWPTTTDIGCGMASGSGFKWLVCRYSPGGNKDGHPVGMPQPAKPPRLALAQRVC